MPPSPDNPYGRAHHNGLAGCRRQYFSRSSPPCWQPRAERTWWLTTLTIGGSTVRGHIRRRGPAGSWEYIIDVGMATAPSAARAAAGASGWSESPSRPAPRAAASSVETEERRRKTKAGFATRKDCRGGHVQGHDAVEEHSYVVPTRITCGSSCSRSGCRRSRALCAPTTLRQLCARYV